MHQKSRSPKTLGTVVSLCGPTIVLLAACTTGDDPRLASALEPAVAAATAPTALIRYSTVVRIASDGEETVLYPLEPLDVEPAVYRDGTAPHWEFAEGIKASRPSP